ncbi:MAG: hypothetical protein QM758_20220 [Armatimonas sp.]
MKSLALALTVLLAGAIAQAKPPSKETLATRFAVTNLGTPGDRVALSPQGAVAVGFALKPGYVRTPDGKKTPLQEGFLPWAITSKGAIGGQLSNRAAVIKNGQVDILFPDQAVTGQTTVVGLADTSPLIVFGRGTESPQGVSWSLSLFQQEKELEDTPSAMADDGGYLTDNSASPERVLPGGKRQKLVGLEGQDWTHATHIARGGLACGYTESSGPGYVNAVWWDIKGGIHRLSAPAYKGKDSARNWYGSRAHRINARGDVLGTATLEAKWPVGVRATFCYKATDLEILLPKSGKPIILDELFVRGSYGRLVTVEGLADNGTLLVRTRGSKQERLLLLKPKK